MDIECFMPRLHVRKRKFVRFMLKFIVKKMQTYFLGEFWEDALHRERIIILWGNIAERNKAYPKPFLLENDEALRNLPNY